MTEPEWFSCTDPNMMIGLVRGKASERKYRLFGCACCRRLVWPLLSEERSTKAVDTAERYADGLASKEALASAGELAHEVTKAFALGTRAHSAAFAAEAAAKLDWSGEVLARHAMCAAYSSGECPPYSVERRSKAVREHWKYVRAMVQDAKTEASALLRDIFDNPFRGITLDSSWLQPRVLSLAQGIYNDRAFGRMSEMAEALEAAGCMNREILSHLRGPGPHVRGCWALDLILAKS
jgi:hypothetical protein